jgi:hypothetical protein
MSLVRDVMSFEREIAMGVFGRSVDREIDKRLLVLSQTPVAEGHCMRGLASVTSRQPINDIRSRIISAHRGIRARSIVSIPCWATKRFHPSGRVYTAYH